MTPYQTLLENIESGKYNNRNPYPSSGFTEQFGEEESQEMKRAWQAENKRILGEFRIDIEEAFGLTDHTKADEIWHLTQNDYLHNWNDICVLYAMYVKQVLI